MNGCEIKNCRHYRDGSCAYAGHSCIYRCADKGEPNAILLPLKEIQNDGTRQHWQEFGWNKAMREAARRLEANGIPVIIIKPDQPEPDGSKEDRP